MSKLPPYTNEANLPYYLTTADLVPYYNYPSTPTIEELKDEMHYMRLPGGNRRYPLPFARSLRNRFEPNEYGGWIQPARKFARTAEAKNLILSEEALLNWGLFLANREGLISARDVTTLYFIGRATLTGWEQRGEVEVERVNGLVYVTEDSLRQACVWQRPASFPEQPNN